MDRLVSYGRIFLLVAMIGDLLVSLFLPLFYSEYSILKMSISALGNPASPVRIPFNLWMLAEGCLFLLSLPAVYRHFRPTSRGIAGVLVAFIAVFAVGACVFTCFFSVNESKDVVTVATLRMPRGTSRSLKESTATRSGTKRNSMNPATDPAPWIIDAAVTTSLVSFTLKKQVKTHAPTAKTAMNATSTPAIPRETGRK